MPSLANLEGDETFEASYLGEAAEVCQTRISDDELILVKGTKARTASSIILRGPNDFYCDEMERSVHDALCVVKVGKVFFVIYSRMSTPYKNCCGYFIFYSFL